VHRGMTTRPPARFRTQSMALLQRRERHRDEDAVLHRDDDLGGVALIGLPVGVGGEIGAALLAMRQAVIGPDMDDLVEGADLAGEEADQLAEQALLDRQSALAIEGDPFRRLARLHRVGAFLDDHVSLLLVAVRRENGPPAPGNPSPWDEAARQAPRGTE